MENKVVNESNIRRPDPVSLLKKNAMLIVLVLVYIFFTIMTKGRMFKPNSFNSLITQNAYVFILGCGMLMCMLTGGNIDLSCGSFVCLLGALGGMMMVMWGWGTGISLLVMLLAGIAYGCGLGFLIAYVRVPPWIATLAGYLSFRGLGTSFLGSLTRSRAIPTDSDVPTSTNTSASRQNFPAMPALSGYSSKNTTAGRSCEPSRAWSPGRIGLSSGQSMMQPRSCRLLEDVTFVNFP